MKKLHLAKKLCKEVKEPGMRKNQMDGAVQLEDVALPEVAVVVAMCGQQA